MQTDMTNQDIIDYLTLIVKGVSLHTIAVYLKKNRPELFNNIKDSTLKESYGTIIRSLTKPNNLQ